MRNLTLEGADATASVVRATPAGVETGLDHRQRRGRPAGTGPLTITRIESMEDTGGPVAGGSGYLTRTPSAGELDEGMARGIVESGRRNAEYGLV